MALIEIRNMVKSYEGLLVLDGVDLFLEAGKSYAITGKSGSGKSTLLHVASLLDKPDSGEYFLDGKEITEEDYRSDTLLSRTRLFRFGFVFQDNFLIGDYTALDNVVVPLALQGIPKTDAEALAREALDAVGLRERMRHKPAELSTGEKQRVSICRALVSAPDVIFADEPTGALDEENAAVVEEMLLSLSRDGGRTLVLVTHDADFAMMCDNVYRIQSKKLVRIK